MNSMTLDLVIIFYMFDNISGYTATNAGQFKTYA